MKKHKYTFQEIRQMFAEVATLQKATAKENDKRFAELVASQKELAAETQKNDKRLREKSYKLDLKFEKINQVFQRTGKYINNLSDQVGGIGNSNGDVAENFFYQGFLKNMLVNNIEYKYLEKNKNRAIGNLKVEYDIILINTNKVLIIEVKYKLKKEHVKSFYNTKLPKYKILFPEYKDYTIYGALAALSFESGADETAKNKGFLVFTQSGENIKKLSPDNILLSEF